jgi:lipooligosaccharide transport system permease protein
MSHTVLVWRVLPVSMRATHRALRLIERSITVYRRTPMVLVSGFFEPLFYLFSIRVGFGALVGDIEFAGRSIGYAEFVAPALMASAAMNGAIYDSTMNIFFKLKYERVYDAVLATPVSSTDVAAGEIGWAVLRGVLYSTSFMLCIVLLGMTESVWILASLPICMLIGFAFSAAGMALTTFMRSWNDFEWVQAITMPMFLFSATFYPLSSYGSWGWIVQISPLYHGAALVRMASLGDASWGIVVHIAYLAALSVGGLTIASRRIDSLLLK